VGHRQDARAIEDRRQVTRQVGAHVQDDEHGGRQIGGQAAQQRGQRRDAAAGRADDDDVAMYHPGRLCKVRA
jgi:hypothetical protein